MDMSRGPKPRQVILSPEEGNALKECIHRHQTAQQMALRARLVLAAATEKNNTQIAQELDVGVEMVRLWRGRWLEQQAIPLSEKSVEARLSDVYRSGAPVKFSAEQVTQIIALACEAPEASGYPVSHWTESDWAREAVKRGLVESISPRQVGRFLKSGGVTTPPQSLLAQHERKR
jgi:transposase